MITSGEDRLQASAQKQLAITARVNHAVQSICVTELPIPADSNRYRHASAGTEWNVYHRIHPDGNKNPARALCIDLTSLKRRLFG
jgi:hypothetical protein